MAPIKKKRSSKHFHGGTVVDILAFSVYDTVKYSVRSSFPRQHPFVLCGVFVYDIASAESRQSIVQLASVHSGYRHLSCAVRKVVYHRRLEIIASCRAWQLAEG